MKLRNVAVGAVLAVAPVAAFAAQDTRFSATAGFGTLDSGGDAPIPGPVSMPPMSHLDHESDDTVFSGSFAWHATDRWAIELWGTLGAQGSVDIDVENGHDIPVAAYDVQPIALTAQYRFAPIHERFTPFIGLGWHRTRISGVSSNPAVDEAAGLQVRGDSGFAAVVGLDVALDKRWFVRGDVRYLDWDQSSMTRAQPWVTTSGANSFPNLTRTTPPEKPLPSRVTTVRPPAGPLAGRIDVISGGGLP